MSQLDLSKPQLMMIACTATVYGILSFFEWMKWMQTKIFFTILVPKHLIVDISFFSFKRKVKNVWGFPYSGKNYFQIDFIICNMSKNKFKLILYVFLIKDGQLLKTFKKFPNFDIIRILTIPNIENALCREKFITFCSSTSVNIPKIIIVTMQMK